MAVDDSRLTHICHHVLWLWLLLLLEISIYPSIHHVTWWCAWIACTPIQLVATFPNSYFHLVQTILYRLSTLFATKWDSPCFPTSVAPYYIYCSPVGNFQLWPILAPYWQHNGTELPKHNCHRYISTGYYGIAMPMKKFPLDLRAAQGKWYGLAFLGA